MAKKNDINSNGIISRMINTVKNSIGNIYKNTYYNQNTDSINLDNVKRDLSSSIDKIMSNNYDSVGDISISTVYSRLQQKYNKSNSSSMKELDNMFNDRNITDNLLMNNYMDNKSIKDYDDEIDLLCKHMPQLQDALDAKKDNVLSADHFSKDFINTVNTTNLTPEAQYLERIKYLKDKYNLIEEFENIYDRAAKYGEQFVYIVPYNKVLTGLMKDKDSKCIITPGFYSEAFKESEYIQENIFNMDITIDNTSIKIVTESGKIVNDKNTLGEDIFKDNTVPNINLQLNVSGIIESVVQEKSTIDKFSNKMSSKEYTKYVTDTFRTGGKTRRNKELEAPDGITDYSMENREDKIQVPGCVFKLLDRERIIPIYIDDLCLGYYYIEFDLAEMTTNTFTTDVFSKNKYGVTGIGQNVNTKLNNDKLLMYISGQMSRFIDKQFIEANKDISKEIYMILKANDELYNKKNLNIKATYIPPEDITHVYFKKDPKTNRGISDLDLSIIPAKYYTALNQSNTLGILTRGQDKRIYYVKQNIDTNISQTLLNTINQIKKSNFGSRELTNIKTLLNVTGRYNDYVVPMGGSGDSPLNVEVMQGQNIDPKTELLQQFEEMAISATDVPYDYIQGRRQTDFATRLTMTNGKFIRICYKRQGLCNRFFGKIITKLYQSEYEEKEIIEVILPPPAFLNTSNVAQMIEITANEAEQIVQMELAHEDDDKKKLIFAKNLKRHYLSTYLDMATIDKIKKDSELEYAKLTNPEEEQ